jgi:8-oxo-dGTP pyrophosphatase MutT (NUDIX family)
MTFGVRGVVLDPAGRVFLVKHTYVSGWHLPGGGVEVGETAMQSLERELREEGNIALDGDPSLHGLFFNRRISQRDHVAVYVVRQFRQLGTPEPNHEILATGFFAVDALPDDTTRGTRARIREVVEGATSSTDWS